MTQCFNSKTNSSISSQPWLGSTQLVSLLGIVVYCVYLFVCLLGASYFPKQKKKKLNYDVMLEEVRADWKRKYSEYVHVCTRNVLGKHKWRAS